MSRAIPRLRMFARPNGSGKSTIKAVVEDEIGPELFGVYINADEIELEISQSGYLDISAYGVDSTTDEILDFFRNSVFLAEKKLSEDAAKLGFADGKLIDDSMRWLKDEVSDYWQQKQAILSILRYISRLPIEHWKDDAYWAGLLAGTVENDGV
jgi:hypothetical protein